MFNVGTGEEDPVLCKPAGIPAGQFQKVMGTSCHDVFGASCVEVYVLKFMQLYHAMCIILFFMFSDVTKLTSFPRPWAHCL